ncbi:MAG TPA: SRPBCC family protein [Nocardioides sp.]|nr:SRPBCC family protein [Nocardioides sp.]
MGVVGLEVERLVAAPIQEVFARLADIEGYGDWMPDRGSMLRHTQQTSPGEPGPGTTYLDSTTFGPTPGEIAQFEPPHTLVFHWWDRSRRGRLHLEGWPGYSLSEDGDDRTLVRHHATLATHGMYRLATPVLRRLALRERTATLEALQASFAERHP